jgi:hypothetical protein
MIVGRVEPATNVLNQMSNVLQIQANYWTGTASAADIWWIYNGERPNGGTSRSTLVFNHTGSNGSANGSNYNVVFSGDNSADAAFSCAHEDPLFTTNSTMCLLVASVNTAGSGADMQVFNNATSGSGKTRIMQTSGIPGAGAITHFSETDPNVTASAEFGESIGPGGANYYPYLFINGVSTNLPSLYLGGSAFSGASGAALAIQLDNTFPCCGGPRRLVSAFPLTQIDFTAPSGADAVKPFQVLAGGTSSVNGAAVYDPTANNLHVGRNAADAIVALLTSTPVTGDCAEWTVASGSITIGDAGFACGSGGGGGSPGGSPDATQINGGGGTFVGVNSPIVNGLYQYVYNVTASAAVVPTTALPGVPVNAQSGAYPLVYSDRASYIKESGGSTATLTLPQVTGNTAANMPFVTQNLNSGNETLTANAADKIDNSGTGGSATLLPNFAAFVYQDGSSAPGNWWTIKVPTYAAFGATCANDGSHANVWSTTEGWSCVVIAGGGGGDMSTSSVNTMTGSGTIDMSALSVTTAFKPPAAAGAAPTTLGVVAFDTTNKVLQCGDGTNTNHCMESPIIFGFQQTGVLTGATSFGSLAGVNGYNATEVIRTAMLPFTGLMRALCVTTTNTQPASNSLAITLRDTTAAADTALTFTIAASSGAGTYCDNTHVVAITGQHSYSIKLVETGASTSATVAGGSAIYRY